MCWSMGVTAAMVGLGAVATALSARRGDAVAIPATLGYFTAMEALQLAGYAVVDQCGNPANESVTFLSVLHIIFQPFLINAFAMQLVPAPVRVRAQVRVYVICALAAALMLMQLYPFGWAGPCRPGFPLCGSVLCTVSGDWHIGWDVPYNGLMVPLEQALGIHSGFPAYLVAAFVVPLFYGAWRFVLFHALIGPVLATRLTTNPNEGPAIWCLFSIGIILIALSPAIRRRFQTPDSSA